MYTLLKTRSTIMALGAYMVCNSLLAQSQKLTLKGIVLEQTSKGQQMPLIGAFAYWAHSTEYAETDTNGVFTIPFPESNTQDSIDHAQNRIYRLIVSYVGYKSDTLDVRRADQVKILLAPSDSRELKEIEVTHRVSSSYTNVLDPLNTRTMTEKELFKAACCNLSESFETNPWVDVSFSDAISGAKQIQMLGLSGIYTQLLQENLPGVRGISSPQGLSYTPGTWIESIQVTKGTGSVVNGYESMAGQINVELKKTEVNPKSGERIYANAYLNDFGRAELNANVVQRIHPKWTSATLLHTNGQFAKIDQNADGFLDIPLGRQYNVLQRLKYENKGWIAQMGARSLSDERVGGQASYRQDSPSTSSNPYGVELTSLRNEAFGKLGYVFPNKKYKSVGLQTFFVDHRSDQKFGFTRYQAHQQTLYANWIYQSIISSTLYKYRTGLSMLTDRLDEKLTTLDTLWQPKRMEVVPGIFAELQANPWPKFTAILGLRADYHSLFGYFLTPRVHLKYDITDNTQWRVTMGRGQRTSNILAENSPIFASSRVLQSSPDIKGTGAPEVSWNIGTSLSHKFWAYDRKGTLSVDVYRTQFTKQIVTDLDASPQAILIYPLTGASYSHSVQAEAGYEIAKGLDTRLAYRFYDVRTQYTTGVRMRPFVSTHRVFANVGYTTGSQWKFDYTITWNGPKRLPDSYSNPSEYQWRSHSPGYFIMNAQVSKSLGSPKKHWWDLYLGAENLGNFRQQTVIIDAASPYSPYFDSSILWGPITGRMWYAGVRYKWK